MEPIDWQVRIQDATRYTIDAGEQNFSPNESLWPLFSVDGFELAVRFDESAYVGLMDWEGDKDWYDWNKLKGVTNYFSANNRSTALIAWRWGPVKNTFQLCAYTNDDRGDWKAGDYITVAAGEVAYARCILSRRGDAHYTLQSYGTVKETSHRYPRPKWFWIAREVGTWIGGADNSPGQYGGKATKRMELDIDFKLYK